ncbi:pleiotropic drug resistance protein 3-like isoform X1 [Rhododendron vialii]|uniref:pleiotropic drug resistance protein 3-like isoform X1 n=1 Tax=Rhododendron vialii TaxID=182163 RepID=UPI00265E7981|nr:pleiotropic drug resistance protein 3-like isoform X1 [Rhododendron vialii]
MDQSVGNVEIKSPKIELVETGKSWRSSSAHPSSSFINDSGLSSVKDDNAGDDCVSEWAQIDRLPTFQRLRTSLVDENIGTKKVDIRGKRVVDVTQLSAPERHIFVEKLIKNVEDDNLQLLQKMRRRIDKVGVELPTVVVRYNSFRVEAECEVVRGKPLPTLWNSVIRLVLDCTKLIGLKSQEAKINIIDDFKGIIKSGRMTLLLGPPGCGKTTLLKALSGNLDKSLKVAGEVFYNGHKLEEFIPHKTSAYVSQNDLHIPEMTVREALDFSACCQGVGNRAEIMAEVIRREKQARVVPNPDIDTYMKAISIEGQNTTLQTDYVLKILGLNICAETIVGDAMRRGVSGGQKKRLTTGEIIVGPARALFMDEISNGLDSSTTYQMVACLQQLAHITDATILVTLLQPAPEIFDLFDDIILMAEGKTVYHGPRSHILDFFDDCGFRCPKRKGVADFLQEVISRKDQAQYWHQAEQSYSYISVDLFQKKFKESTYGKKLDEELSLPFMECCHNNACGFGMYSLSNWALFRACMSREWLLMKRNSFIYVFKSVQLVITAAITVTMSLKSGTGIDATYANHYLGASFYAIIVLFFDGLPELTMTVARLPIFYKQRDLCFYPAWSYAISSTILKVPLSLLVALIWTSLTYYGIGYSPEPGRFFGQIMLFFAMHFAAISLFRFLASVFRTMVSSLTSGSFAILYVFLFGGFMIPKASMPTWLKWGFWVSPLSYGEVGLAVNEFLAPRWQKKQAGNPTIGNETLESHGIPFNAYFFWISFGALLGFAVLFNIGFALALTFLNPPRSRAIISNEKVTQTERREDSSNGAKKEAKLKSYENTTSKPHKDQLVLPFEPLTLSFQDVQYYVETPMKKLQLLCDITGALRPGILTALMGVTGAGKTTLLDVLAGRKTTGIVEGNIRIGGHPKVQDTFARISGYCEQTDVHSPYITIEESVVHSAWLRLHPEIDSKTKIEFVREVLEIIELDEIMDCLVGIPGVSGLSIEQRKRLTIAVELVANPSIIFMDEPTTGLDARAAAIVMRAVKNVADTGRTIVCTIHQPSIDIFEAFDELILLKTGGHIIYSGPLGQHSSSVVKYFEDISGVPTIRNNYNPATWMLEITSISSEAELGIDFAQLYKNSVLYMNNKALVTSLSNLPDSKQLHFATRFPQNGWGQFKSCLWKQHLSYWRSPSYILNRYIYSLIASLLVGILFWDQGRKIDNQQNIFNVLGAAFNVAFSLGINNCKSIIPYVSSERPVFYRERFAGMYGSWAYALAQVVIEVPHILAQAIIFVIITYPMVGYYWSLIKVLWYFYAVLCTLMYFTYFGMLLSAMTPGLHIAAILQSPFYSTWMLFSGFFIPQQQIPNWWIWMYYLAPTSWTLQGIFTSQYGDVQKEMSAFGETTTVSAFISNYFGYNHDQLPMVGVALISFPIVFASLFAYCIGKLNFQKR